jgi:hypothetical protein
MYGGSNAMYPFSRLFYWSYRTNGFDIVSKGDNDEMSSERIKQCIELCSTRGRVFKIMFIVAAIVATAMDTLCIILDDKNDRIITASIGISFIFISNFLSWPQYSEKLQCISDFLEDMKDTVEAGEELTSREKIRLRRIMLMITSPLLFSDKKQYKKEKSKISLLPLSITV